MRSGRHAAALLPGSGEVGTLNLGNPPDVEDCSGLIGPQRKKHSENYQFLLSQYKKWLKV